MTLRSCRNILSIPYSSRVSAWALAERG